MALHGLTSKKRNVDLIIIVALDYLLDKIVRLAKAI